MKNMQKLQPMPVRITLLNVTFKASNGRVVDLPKDGLGELGGWYVGTWREMSKERYIDDFSDLR